METYCPHGTLIADELGPNERCPTCALHHERVELAELEEMAHDLFRTAVSTDHEDERYAQWMHAKGRLQGFDMAMRVLGVTP